THVARLQGDGKQLRRTANGYSATIHKSDWRSASYTVPYPVRASELFGQLYRLFCQTRGVLLCVALFSQAPPRLRSGLSQPLPTTAPSSPTGRRAPAV